MINNIHWKAAKALALVLHLKASGEILADAVDEDAALDLMDRTDEEIDTRLKDFGLVVSCPPAHGGGFRLSSFQAANDFAWFSSKPGVSQ